MIYYYARVSSKEQNLDRQLENAKQFEIDKIFTDKASGKDFDRPSYQEMKSMLKAGDTVILQTLDRLGRNKELIKAEMEWFKKKDILVRIGDVPTTMVQTDKKSKWMVEMMNNVIIEILSTMAEQERQRILERQRQGIDAMLVVDGKKISRKTGKAYGRAKIDAEKIAKIQKGVHWSELGISKGTWYNYRRKGLAEGNEGIID